MSNLHMKSCKACSQQISKNAQKCPHCGEQNITAWHAILSVIFLLGLLWFFFGKGIENSVAKDAVNQYEISRKGGDKAEICAYAGLVVAAFNQAQDEQNYLSWKEIERKDCEDAGMPKR